MKKILVLLLMISVVAGMSLPAMADTSTSAGSSSEGGVNKLDIDNTETASNYAANTVNVVLNAAPQSNYIGKNIAASGSATNGAVATFEGKAEAEDANSGAAVSGGSGSGKAISGGAGASVDKVKVGENNHDDVEVNPEAETGDAKSESETGDADSGNAENDAEVEDNTNKASADHNHLSTGKVYNDIDQVNVQKQIAPVIIKTDQKVKQNIVIKDIDQEANSDAKTIAKAESKEKKIDIKKTDIKKTDIDTRDIIVAPFWWLNGQ